jgi:hypothetical protein
MGFFDTIFGPKKYLEKYCRFKQKEVIIMRMSLLQMLSSKNYNDIKTPIEYYSCIYSFLLTCPHIDDFCPHTDCVYSYQNADGIEQALGQILGIPGLTKEELCKRVSKLSFDEFTTLMEEYRRKDGIQNYCK